MNKYLVISYDNDAQQWFHDIIVEVDEHSAVSQALEDRPYAIAAEALTLNDIREFAEELEESI